MRKSETAAYAIDAIKRTRSVGKLLEIISFYYAVAKKPSPKVREAWVTRLRKLAGKKYEQDWTKFIDAVAEQNTSSARKGAK